MIRAFTQINICFTTMSQVKWTIVLMITLKLVINTLRADRLIAFLVFQKFEN